MAQPCHDRHNSQILAIPTSVSILRFDTVVPYLLVFAAAGPSSGSALNCQKQLLIGVGMEPCHLIGARTYLRQQWKTARTVKSCGLQAQWEGQNAHLDKQRIHAGIPAPRFGNIQEPLFFAEEQACQLRGRTMPKLDPIGLPARRHNRQRQADSGADGDTPSLGCSICRPRRGRATRPGCKRLGQSVVGAPLRPAPNTDHSNRRLFAARGAAPCGTVRPHRRNYPNRSSSRQ